MSINTNWPRWIFASVTSYFVTGLSSAGYDKDEIFVEGTPRPAVRGEDFFEIRVDGPDFIEISKDCHRVDVEINILIQSVMDDTNFHRKHTDIGVVTNLFQTIPIFRLGPDNPPDDGTALGCLILLQDRRRREIVKVNQLGQIDPNTKLEHTTIGGQYKMILNE